MGTILNNANLNNATINNRTNFTGAGMQNAHLPNAILKDGFHLTEAELYGANIDGTGFSKKEKFIDRGVKFYSKSEVPEGETRYLVQKQRQIYACKDPYVAKGILRQLLVDKEMEWGREDLYTYMETHCPDIAKQVLR
jgi:hypothetical protein